MWCLRDLTTCLLAMIFEASVSAVVVDSVSASDVDVDSFSVWA